MIQNKRNSSKYCPKCKNDDCLHRIHRRFLDRLLSILVPVSRYHCYYCNWQGTLPQKIKLA